MNKKTEALMKTLLSEPVAVIHLATPHYEISQENGQYYQYQLPDGHAEYEDTPRTVAIIDMEKTLSVEEKLEKAFMMTNSIDSAWYKSDKVNYIGPEKTCRSTTTGDFVLIGKDKYVCNSTGWSKV
jgi:hypothetical protein